MRIQIEINNPHYVRVIEDMAQAVGVEVEVLCAGMVEKGMEDYQEAVTAFKRAGVMKMLPGDLVNRLVATGEAGR